MSIYFDSWHSFRNTVVLNCLWVGSILGLSLIMLFIFTIILFCNSWKLPSMPIILQISNPHVLEHNKNNTHIHKAVPWLCHDVCDIMTLHGLKSKISWRIWIQQCAQGILIWTWTEYISAVIKKVVIQNSYIAIAQESPYYSKIMPIIPKLC